MPRPRAGDWLEDEVLSWKQSGIDLVVSLLTAEESSELGLDSERDVCERLGLRFLNFPIPDRSVPDTHEPVNHLINQMLDALQSNQSIAIHCRMGVGRSAMIAACLLMSCGLDHPTAWKQIEIARGVPVPDTIEQKNWVQKWIERRSREV